MAPLACVIGGMDLVRPLALAGIRCAVVAPAGEPPHYSRAAVASVEWADPWREPELLVERLLAFAAAQPEPPVLYYEEDRDLLLVSRHRDALRPAFRFVVGDAELVEDLADKVRFRELAQRLGLPVPASRRLSSAEHGAPPPGLRPPLLLKPATRRGFERWAPLAGGGKALSVETDAQLATLWPALRAADVELLAQELVPGPETRIESYHAYVTDAGETAAEFTGRKIRTRPAEFGFSTALELTDAPDVAELGRELVARLALTGIAKLDFKRAPDGSLRLLEVNPRFNLWHHLAARAGANVPALVHADLTGAARPPVARPRAGARWVFHVHDALAAREQGVPPWRWLPWALRADAISAFAPDDPLPFLRGVLLRRARRLLAP